MVTGNKKSIATKLSRKKWLEFSLDILIKEGNSTLHIDRLIQAMGVTKGSFYWHFKDRDDFILSLVEHWYTVFTVVVIERMKKVEGSAEERLFELMKFILSNDLTRYDIPIRALRQMGDRVAYIVEKADKRRLEFIRDLFAEIGFEGNDLEMRVLTLVVFLSMEHGLLIKNTKQDRIKMLRKRHAMFIHPA